MSGPMKQESPGFSRGEGQDEKHDALVRANGAVLAQQGAVERARDAAFEEALAAVDALPVSAHEQGIKNVARHAIRAAQSAPAEEAKG